MMHSMNDYLIVMNDVKVATVFESKLMPTSCNQRLQTINEATR